MILKIGHRGAKGYAPENTLKSFKKALSLNVDAVELDVFTCKSGELVVIHDDKINRTTDGKGYVSDKTLNELKSLDAGEGEKIPLLSEVLDLISGRIKVNIELKGPNTAKSVNKLIEYYIKKRSWNYEDFLISSFNMKELRIFRNLNTKVKIGILMKKKPVEYNQVVKEIEAHSINLHFKSVTGEFVEDAHRNGLKVYTWTVNDFSDIKKMKELKVDGIFSDFPDRL